jgi:drug/metabolite transporter, DME family
LSILFFNWSYFTAIQETSLSVAVVLLYTGPAFVVLMARVVFKELITIRKQLALLITLIGIILVSELFPRGGFISVYGLTVGVGAGFGYALYSIFSKLALKKYKPFTILFYTFLVASLFILPVSSLITAETASKLMDVENVLAILGMALLTTILAYFLYTEGLSRMEAGKASITAMTEPVAATIFGIWLFQESLSLYQAAGMVLVLLSVLMIQKSNKG